MALSYYHSAHTGLEEIGSEANTKEQMEAGCLTECPSRGTTGVECGPGLTRMPLMGHCFSDSVRVNKTQHIFYNYIFAVFNLVFLASSFPISWSQVWGINLLYAPSFLVLCFFYFPVFLFFFLLAIKAPVICQPSWAQVAAFWSHGMSNLPTNLEMRPGFLKKEKKKTLVLPVYIPKAQIIKKPIAGGNAVSNE